MRKTKLMSGRQAVIETLAEQDVMLVFGIPGGHSLPLYDAIYQHPEIKNIVGRHEQGLGFVADGYARATSKTGVVLVTSGPAVGNLTAALGTATTDISPVLVIASTVRSELVGKNRGGLHDCGEQIKLANAVTRYHRRCMNLEDIPVVITELLNLLQTGRSGGAYYEIPADILKKEGEASIPEKNAIKKKCMMRRLLLKPLRH